jgi:hypothetical protein
MVGTGHGFHGPSHDDRWNGRSEEIKLLLLLSLFAILLPKSLNPSCRIQKLLFPCKERMTAGTDFHMDLFLSTLRLERGSAGTFDHRIIDLGVDILFHLLSLRFLFYRFLNYFQLFLFSDSAICFRYQRLAIS